MAKLCPLIPLNYPYFLLFLLNYPYFPLNPLIFIYQVKDKIMSSNIRIESTCDFCGKNFIAKTLKTRYCSHTCNSRDYKRKLKNEKVSKEVKNRKDKKDLEALKNREYLSVKDAAVIVGCSTKTVYRLISDGTIKSVNLSKRLTRINKKSLDKIIS